jgi:hypothetical protein
LSGSDAPAPPRRRRGWLDFALLLILVPTIAAVFFRLSPMVSGPLRILVKVGVILLPIALLVGAVTRVRRR